MNGKNILAVLAALLVLFAAAAGCNKKSETPAGSGNVVLDAPDVSWGVMKKGSVDVNGVTYAIGAGAQIVHDDSPGSEDLLQDGMTVKVRGKRNDDGATGEVVKLETECELQGIITATGADSITLLEQQAYVDSRTVIANADNFQELAEGDWVTIHGLRDPLGRLLATRIEVRPAGSGPSIDRLRGVVEAPFTGGTPPDLAFVLRGVTVVTARGTLIQPDGATISLGDSVTVHGFLSGSTMTAGRIDREDLEDAGFDPQESEAFEVDGFVSGFTTTVADFTVAGKTVRMTAATRFEDGVAEDLVNNVRVEAEGQMTGGALVSTKIKFDDTVRFRANADGAGSASVLGKTVIITSRTDQEKLDGGVSGILAGQGLRIRGFENADGTVTATEVIGQSGPVEGNGFVVQGIVKGFDASLRTLSILGITFDVSGASAFGPHADTGFEHQAVSLDEFFSLLTTGRSVVKGEGTFTAGTPSVLTATKVELE
jgi:hypothetical protein